MANLNKLPHVMTATVGAALIAFTSLHEGLRTHAYADIGGIPTICFGSTAGVKLGQTATNSECIARLQKDEADAYATLGHVGASGLTEGETVAYTDFIFNVGAKSFQRSTLRNKLAHGEHKAACAELLKWVYVKQQGKLVVSRGIQARRNDEYKLCMRDL